MERALNYINETLLQSPLGQRVRTMLLRVFRFLDYPHASERRALQYGNTSDFLFVPEIQSSKKHLYAENVSFLAVVAVVASLAVWLLSLATGLSAPIIISGIIALFYLTLMVFKLWIVYHALSEELIHVTDEEVRALRDADLPVYTILIPLYQESEVVSQIKQAMTAIDYPTDKLDVIITLESYDTATINAIEKADIPAHFKTLILPDVQPKTKPKALNVAFLKAKGEFLVIYDAEIIPEPAQLKKAVIAFRANPHLGSLQTHLDHYNIGQNIITRLFNAEFSFYYDLFLPGLQKFNFPIPLSGHSTHFRRAVLEGIGAWDPYNVTEDCDVGIRLHRAGYRTGILNSVSYEEATSSLKSWIFQRTRWMKGFIQTTIVHLRHPLRFKREIGGSANFGVFFLLVPGTVIVNILNLAYWLLFAIWLVTKADFIQSFFPLVVLYLSAISFLIGNFIFTYLNLYGAYQRGRYNLVKWSILSPIYWILLAVASTRAAFQIFFKPHTWEKTKHGDHLQGGKHFIIWS